MVTKNNQQIVAEDAVTSRRLTVSILNYVKVVYKLHCAIKVSGCDDNYYYLDKCFKLKKKEACHYRIGMFLVFQGRLWYLFSIFSFSDHYPSQNIFRMGPQEFSGAIPGLLLQG